jgi:hypothetical protein
MRPVLTCLTLLLTLAVPGRSLGCTIPVYRYALERWDLATYELLVYHRGPLPKDLAAAVSHWQQPGRGNLEVVPIDLDGKVSAEQQRVWKEQEAKATLPWLVVRLPGPDVEKPIAWTGPLSAANLAAVADSPVRQRIVSSLQRGETTVYLLLRGSDAAENEAAVRLVGDELKRLEQLLKLPIQSTEGPQLRLPLPLQVKFTLIELDRNAPAEQQFIRMLLATEEGLDEVKGPILMPIFGRGRLLGSLFGKDINAGEVFNVAQFLCKECSCQLKELNPGTDLLTHADWPAIFEKITSAAAESPPAPAETPPAPASGPALELETATLQAVPPATEAPSAPSAPPPAPPVAAPIAAPPAAAPVSVGLASWASIAILGVVGVIVLAGVWMSVRPSDDR